MFDPRSFLDELKRRKVFRTAAVYALVAWGVIQVADVVWTPLGLPEWTLTLVIALAVLGFPLILTVEWVFEVTSDGVRRTSRSEEPARGGSLLSRPVAVGGAILLLGGLTSWMLGGPGGPEGTPAPISESAVAVFPCEVSGSEGIAHMGEGMVHLLASKLRGTGTLTPLDPRTVLNVLEHEPVDATDPRAVRRIAAHMGAGQYIRCDLVELFEGDVHMEAALYRLSDDDRPRISAAVEGQVADIPRIADELAARILTGSGGSRSRMAQEAARISDPVSLEAWKAYVEGETAYRAGAFEEAMAAFGEAGEIDPTFALARYRQARAASWAERHDVKREALDAAKLHGDRLSAHDRALLEAYDAYARGEHVRAKRLYGELTRAHPNDLEAWYQLGETLFHYGWLSGEPGARADSALTRADRLDPGRSHYDVLFHLVHLTGGTGDFTRFDSLAARLERAAAEDPRAWGARLMFRGDSISQDSVVAAIEAGDINFLFAELAPTLSLGHRVASAFTPCRDNRSGTGRWATSSGRASTWPPAGGPRPWRSWIGRRGSGPSLRWR